MHYLLVSVQSYLEYIAFIVVSELDNCSPTYFLPSVETLGSLVESSQLSDHYSGALVSVSVSLGISPFYFQFDCIHMRVLTQTATNMDISIKFPGYRGKTDT